MPVDLFSRVTLYTVLNKVPSVFLARCARRTDKSDSFVWGHHVDDHFDHDSWAAQDMGSAFAPPCPQTDGPNHAGLSPRPQADNLHLPQM